MAKKNLNQRKPGGAAGIAVVEDPIETDEPVEVVSRAATPADRTEESNKAKRKEEASSGSVAVGEIRKAAAFANSVGGLDKALALLQILKVAKEVQ